MKTHTVRLTIAAALAACLLVLAGCSTGSADLDAAISQANVHLQKAAGFEEQVKPLVTRLSGVKYSRAGAAAGLRVTTALTKAIAAEKAELVAARASLASVQTLSVKDEFKKYARLEVAAIDTRIKIADAGAKLYTETGKVYAALRDAKGAVPDLGTVSATMDAITSDIATLTVQAGAQSRAAADYFVTQKLGQ